MSQIDAPEATPCSSPDVNTVPDAQGGKPHLQKFRTIHFVLPQEAPRGLNEVTSTTSTSNDSDTDAAIIPNLKRKLREDLPDLGKTPTNIGGISAIRAKHRRQRKRWPSSSDESYDEITDTEFDLKLVEIYKGLDNTSDEKSEDDDYDTGLGDIPSGAGGKETEVSTRIVADTK